MNTKIDNSLNAAAAMDDTGSYTDGHAADLRKDEPAHPDHSQRPVDCIYARVHGLRRAYIEQRIAGSGVDA